MLRNWLKLKSGAPGVDSARTALERFVASLCVQSDSEIATLVAVAAIIRMRLREAGQLPDDALRIASINEYEQAMVQRHISDMVRSSLSQNEYIEAAGAMVWLHTMRSLSLRELRDLGRKMWQELQRGFLLTPQALAKIEAVTHRAPPAGTLSACVFIPKALESQTEEAA
jgi:hypothetical protein